MKGIRGITTRSERRAMERAKEKYVRNLMAGGFTPFQDITNTARTQDVIADSVRRPERVLLNGLFIVQIYDWPCEWPGTKQMMIRWNDARPDHDWPMFQRIKNEIFGFERVALEVYPAESNKQDVANMYWLFVLPEGFHCPVEWKAGFKCQT